MVQWLRLCLSMQGIWVRSLVRELRSTCLLAKIKTNKTENESNIVTNSIKTNKVVQSKKNFKKRKNVSKNLLS